MSLIDLVKVIKNMQDKNQKYMTIKNIFATHAIENEANKMKNTVMKETWMNSIQIEIMKMIEDQGFLEDIISDYNESLESEALIEYLLKIRDVTKRKNLLRKALKSRSVDNIININHRVGYELDYQSEEIINETLRNKAKEEFLKDESKYIKKFRESVFDKNRDELKFILSAITIYNNSKDDEIKKQINEILGVYIKSKTGVQEEIINKFNQKLFNGEINICKFGILETAKQVEFASVTGEIFEEKPLRKIDIKSLDKDKLLETIEIVNKANEDKHINGLYKLTSIMKIYNLEPVTSADEKNVSKIGTNENVQFGIELEFEGMHDEEFGIYINTIIKNEDLQEKIGLTKEEKKVIRNLEDWKTYNDTSLFGGTEFKSDILKDTQDTWKEISAVSKIIKSMDGYIDKELCAFHVHIDAGILGIDSKAWEMFYKIQQNDEEIIKKISCPIGEKNLKSNSIFAKDIKDDRVIPKAGVKIESKDDLIEFAKKAIKYRYEGNAYKKERITREKRINLTGIAFGDKYTIEDRGTNGLIEYEDIRNGITKSIRIAELAKRISTDKTFEKENQQKINDMLYEDSESKRAKAFIELAFRPEEQKEYLARYENYPDSRESNGEKEK